MIDINSVIDKLKKIFKVKSDVDLSRKLGFSDRVVTTWKQRNTLNFEKIIEIAIEKDIDLNYLFKNNNDVNNEIVDNLFDEFIIFYLKKQKKIDRSSILNLFFNPLKELLTRCLKKEDFDKTIDRANAKQQLINLINNCKISIFFDSQKKRDLLIKEIEEDYSNLECYVLLKYRKYFI